VSRFGYSRRPGQVVDLERPRLDDALLHDDVFAPQESASAALGHGLTFAVANERPRGPIERRGPQPDARDETHRARLVQRAQAALAEEQQAQRGARR